MSLDDLREDAENEAEWTRAYVDALGLAERPYWLTPGDYLLDRGRWD